MTLLVMLLGENYDSRSLFVTGAIDITLTICATVLLVEGVITL